MAYANVKRTANDIGDEICFVGSLSVIASSLHKKRKRVCVGTP